MFNQKRCLAPVKGKQCEKFSLCNALHCSDHITKGQTLYNQYKEICNKIDVYPTEIPSKYQTIPEKIRFYHEYYCLLIRAYKGRLAHRDYGFIPSCFDYGHEIQFTILLEKIAQTEDRLSDLSDLYEAFEEEMIQKEQKQIEEEPVPQTEDIEIVIEKVRVFKRKRVDDSKLVENVLKKYMRENLQLKIETDAIVDKCLKMLMQFAKGSSEYFKLFGIFDLIGRLHGIGYFAVCFKPIKCCDECDDFLFHEVKIADKSINERDNTKDFLSSLHIDSLKALCEIMERDRLLIKHVCGDYNLLWKSHATNLMDTKLTLIWNKTLGRLTLKIESDLNLTKRQHSQMDVKNNRFDNSSDAVSESIIRKFNTRDFFCRFKDKKTSNCAISNLEKVTLQDAMANIDNWVVDFDMDLTDLEKKTVLDPAWRSKFKFVKNKIIKIKKSEQKELDKPIVNDLD